MIACTAVYSPPAVAFSTVRWRERDGREAPLAPQVTRVGDLSVAVERPASPSRKPSVLLIHGMFAGAWYWEGYQGFLARHGYESHAINLRGHHGSRPVRD